MSDHLVLSQIELRNANIFIELHHRHHKPVVGHRFSLAARSNGTIVGVVIVGRPVARMTNQHKIVEVTRLCTDGHRNACSFLYAAAARAASALGYARIQTFILADEDGASLIAAGWTLDGSSAGGDWTSMSKPSRRQDQPQGPKTRWVKDLG